MRIGGIWLQGGEGPIVFAIVETPEGMHALRILDFDDSQLDSSLPDGGHCRNGIWTVRGKPCKHPYRKIGAPGKALGGAHRPQRKQIDKTAGRKFQPKSALTADQCVQRSLEVLARRRAFVKVSSSDHQNSCLWHAIRVLHSLDESQCPNRGAACIDDYTAFCAQSCIEPLPIVLAKYVHPDLTRLSPLTTSTVQTKTAYFTLDDVIMQNLDKDENNAFLLYTSQYDDYESMATQLGHFWAVILVGKAKTTPRQQEEAICVENTGHSLQAMFAKYGLGARNHLQCIVPTCYIGRLSARIVELDEAAKVASAPTAADSSAFPIQPASPPLPAQPTGQSPSPDAPGNSAACAEPGSVTQASQPFVGPAMSDGDRSPRSAPSSPSVGSQGSRVSWADVVRARPSMTHLRAPLLPDRVPSLPVAAAVESWADKVRSESSMSHLCRPLLPRVVLKGEVGPDVEPPSMAAMSAPVTVPLPPSATIRLPFSFVTPVAPAPPVPALTIEQRTKLEVDEYNRRFPQAAPKSRMRDQIAREGFESHHQLSKVLFELQKGVLEEKIRNFKAQSDIAERVAAEEDWNRQLLFFDREFELQTMSLDFRQIVDRPNRLDFTIAAIPERLRPRAEVPFPAPPEIRLKRIAREVLQYAFARGLETGLSLNVKGKDGALKAASHYDNALESAWRELYSGNLGIRTEVRQKASTNPFWYTDLCLATRLRFVEELRELNTSQALVLMGDRLEGITIGLKTQHASERHAAAWDDQRKSLWQRVTDAMFPTVRIYSARKQRLPSEWERVKNTAPKSTLMHGYYCLPSKIGGRSVNSQVAFPAQESSSVDEPTWVFRQPYSVPRHNAFREAFPEINPLPEFQQHGPPTFTEHGEWYKYEMTKPLETLFDVACQAELDGANTAFVDFGEF